LIVSGVMLNSVVDDEVVELAQHGGEEEIRLRKKLMLPPEKLEAARLAFEDGDAQLSARIHDISNTTFMTEKEKHKGGYLKNIMYGGLYGVITTFAVVAATAGATLGMNVTLVMGFASLFAGAASMGVGDFIAEKTKIDYARAEQRREEWEYDNYPKGEIEEMVQIYQNKGLHLTEAEELVAALTKNKNNFIDTMMVEELGLLPPGNDDSPVKNGFVTFLSFIGFGIIPLFPFVIGASLGTSAFWTFFGLTGLLTALTKFFLGAITSRFTILSWWKGGLYTVLMGTIASAVSYVVGWLVGAVLLHPSDF